MLVVAVVLGGMVTAALPAAGQNGPDGVIYVDASATGANDGSSWENAYVSLKDGISGAEAGDEIWVARGTYYPDEGASCIDDDRLSNFDLLTQRSLYGGFAGFETAREQRDWAANPTVLSGDIQQDGNSTNNAYHVTYAGSSGVVLDGFTITGGYADVEGDWNGKGGGMLMIENWGSLTLANCTFYDNYASYGGGIYNDWSVPVLRDCTFEANSALQGAGMYNHYMGDAELTGCSFAGNWASHGGGGMYNELSSPTLERCTFRGNQVTNTGSGGGMANYMSSPVLGNCTFEANQAPNGGGMYNDGNVTSPSLSGCTFRGNLAWGDGGDAGGGGMFNDAGAAPVVNDCTFTGNFAYGDGGAMHNDSSFPVVSGTIFEGNRAEYGGGMYNRYSSPSLGNCTFGYNTAAGGWGGGIYQQNMQEDPASTLVSCIFMGNSAEGSGGIYNRGLITLTDCLFQGNWAFEGGGGLQCDGAWGYGNVTNCVFWGNRCYSDGGAMNVYGSSEADVTNCSFYANWAGPSAGDTGGAIYVDTCSTGSATVVNSILWGDCPDEISGASGAFVTYSDVQGGWGAPDDYNIDADPMWAHPEAGDFHLLPGSPCIDAGDNTAANIPDFDFEGDDRIVDGDGNGTATVDMGVDELMLQSVQVFYDDFEDCSLSNWEQDVQNDWFCSTQRAHDGTHAAEVDGWAVDATLTLKEAIDLSEATEATVSVWWYIESGLDDGEYLALDVWNGTDWVERARLSGENWTGAAEDAWHNEQIVLSGDELRADFKLCFRGTMSLSSEDANVDAVQIMATMP
jgi:hypothetical protein